MDIKRRSFFATLLAPLFAGFLPKLEAPRRYRWIDVTRIDSLNLSKWGCTVFPSITHAENVTFEKEIVRATDPSKPCSVTFGPYYGIAYRSADTTAGSWKNLKRS
jgi:hypothetical protein